MGLQKGLCGIRYSLIQGGIGKPKLLDGFGVIVVEFQGGLAYGFGCDKAPFPAPQAFKLEKAKGKMF